MNIYSLRPEIPRTGQFVVVWVNGVQIWSDTYRIRNDELYFYCMSQGKFVYSDYNSVLVSDADSKLIAVITHPAQTVLMEK